MDVSAVILAGGRGRRMGGTNKAALTLNGESLIDRQIRECSGWTDDIVVVCNEETFGRQIQTSFGVRVTADRLAPCEGPLAGIHAGLAITRYPTAWVIACDQPQPNRRAADLLYSRLVQERALAALPVLSNRLQPLHAIYRKQAAEAAEHLLLQGERRLLALLDLIRWVGVNEHDFAHAGIGTMFADDIDTPADYDRISSRIASQDSQRS